MSTGMRKWMENGCPEIQCLPAQESIDREELKQLRDRLEAAEKRTAQLEERCAVLTDSLRLAVRQNNHDMLMTAEELRACEVTLEKSK